jgi:dihydrofolate reductase
MGETKHQTRPSLGIVVAMTSAGIIGRAGRIPWDLPDDRRLFRQLTEGGTVIMGRRTFESLPRALDNRCNIILSRTGRHAPGVESYPNLSAGLALARRIGRPIFVIGGVEVYREALPLADSLHISWVDGEFAGDRHFPAVDFAAWEVVTTTAYPGFRYVAYRRAAACLKPTAAVPTPRNRRCVSTGSQNA